MNTVKATVRSLKLKQNDIYDSEQINIDIRAHDTVEFDFSFTMPEECL